MRMKEPYEAYLDGFNRLNVYMAKNFYDGESRIFHLKDSQDNIIPLSIQHRSDLYNGYTHYQLSLDSSLHMGEEYFLFDEHCKQTPCIYSHIVKTKEFADQFMYDQNDLGLTYSKEKSIFKLWSPVAHRIVLHVIKNDQPFYFEMNKDEKTGVFSAEIHENLLGAKYLFFVRVNGKWDQFIDPYSSFCGMNGKYSYVIDEAHLDLPKKIKLEPLESNTDAIIYEASVRDMTSQTGIGVTHPKKFVGFVEENKTTKSRNTGFSYIKSLGITHIQLMPVFDFGSVDERYPNIFYNWGYDPVNHRCLEGSYSMEPRDPLCRVKEFAYLVQQCHKNGIRVNLDLVFNHVYEKENYPLEKLVPNYYFLMSQTGEFSNGSFCGNDIDTQPFMSKKYFLDTCKRIIEWFDVDGFRFDLMGILDYNFMNELSNMCRTLKPGFLIYGEGWNMPSFLPEEIRASQQNQSRMPYVGHFSDRFREVIRGSNSELQMRGYSNGNFSCIDSVLSVLSASCKDNIFDSPQKVINYVECHDNHTLWDKNRIACHGEGREMREKRSLMANALVLLAQGVPFIHCGQEFGRTKNNLGNSYNRSDTYNKVDYARRDQHIWIVEQVQKLIKIRKMHPCFRLRTKEEIDHNVFFEVIENQVVVYGTRKDEDECVVFFNPTSRSFEYFLQESGQIIYDSENANNPYTSHLHIAPFSVLVFQVNR